jgi:serine/threonine-protein kinase HipA
MTLSVHLNDQLAGSLWLDAQRRFIFQYEAAWLADSNAVPLSLALPLRPEPYVDDASRPFFTNLLPEAQLRKAIARKLGLSETNDYGLLEAIGGECAGAVSLLPQGQQPDGHGHYQSLNEDELHILIEQLPQNPMLAGEGDMRLSLAGVQNKLPVYFDGQHISLPHGGKASSHILKPAIPEYQNSIFNEAYCMQLAKAVGLTVPEVILINNQGQWLYLVSRYDREMGKEGNLLRLHQEDFCQALGILPETKYEKEGGPGLAACFKLIREQSIQPVVDLRQLLNWVVFNYLIGNADAHGKNVSLLLTHQGPRLAPFYDLMSTAIYPGLSDKPAMKIGGEDRPQWIIARSWQTLAQESGVGFKLVKQTLEKFSRALEQHAPILAKEFKHSELASEVTTAIQTVIHQRSEKVHTSFNAAGL